MASDRDKQNSKKKLKRIPEGPVAEGWYSQEPTAEQENKNNVSWPEGREQVLSCEQEQKQTKKIQTTRADGAVGYATQEPPRERYL